MLYVIIAILAIAYSVVRITKQAKETNLPVSFRVYNTKTGKELDSMQGLISQSEYDACNQNNSINKPKLEYFIHKHQCTRAVNLGLFFFGISLLSHSSINPIEEDLQNWITIISVVFCLHHIGDALGTAIVAHQSKKESK